MQSSAPAPAREVRIPSGNAWLYGDLVLPPAFAGLVLFAHGSGSGRHSARNRQVRGGRPDLAGAVALAAVKAPALLIVGGADHGVIELNQEALKRMQCEKELKIVPGATHLFEERGTLEQVQELAASWFTAHMARAEHTA